MTDQHTPPAWLAALFSYVAVGSRRRKSSEAHAEALPRGRRRHPAGKRARRRGDPVIEYTNRDLPPVAVDALAAIAPPAICEAGCRTLDDCPVIQAEESEPASGARAQLAERAARLREQATHRPYVSPAEADIIDIAPPLPPAELAEPRLPQPQCTDMLTDSLGNVLPSQVAPISAPPVPPEAPAPADAPAPREDTDQ